MAPAPAPGERVAAVVQGSELVFSGLLLDTVRQAADSVGVQVRGYEPLVTLARDGLAVHTAQLTLAGGYAPLLRVVGELERTLPRCRLAFARLAELRRPPDAVLAADPYVVYPAGCTQKIMP